jgi:hypothetical protein
MQAFRSRSELKALAVRKAHGYRLQSKTRRECIAIIGCSRSTWTMLATRGCRSGA